MVRRLAVIALVVVLGDLAGCSTTQSSTAGKGSGVPSAGSSSNAAKASNLVVTDQIRAQLVAAGAALNSIPASEYTGLRPGGTFYAYDPATRTDWAGAALVASPSSQRAQVSTQDDGAYLLFERPQGGSWIAHDVGLAGVEGSSCPIQVPASITELWGWNTGSCRPPDS